MTTFNVRPNLRRANNIQNGSEPARPAPPDDRFMTTRGTFRPSSHGIRLLEPVQDRRAAAVLPPISDELVDEYQARAASLGIDVDVQQIFNRLSERTSNQIVPYHSVGEAIVAVAIWGEADPILVHEAKQFILAHCNDLASTRAALAIAKGLSATDIAAALESALWPVWDVRVKPMGINGTAITSMCIIANDLLLRTTDHQELRINPLDVASRLQPRTIAGTGRPHKVCSLSSTEFIALDSAEHLPSIWQRDVRCEGGWKFSKKLVGHRAAVRDVCAMGENRIVTAAEDGSVRIWTRSGHGSWLCSSQLFVDSKAPKSIYAVGTNAFVAVLQNNTIQYWRKNATTGAVGQSQWQQNDVPDAIEDTRTSCLLRAGLLVKAVNSAHVRIWTQSADGQWQKQEIPTGIGAKATRLYPLGSHSFVLCCANQKASVWTQEDDGSWLEQILNYTFTTDIQHVAAIVGGFIVQSADSSIQVFWKSFPACSVEHLYEGDPSPVDTALRNGHIAQAAQFLKDGAECPSDELIFQELRRRNSALVQLETVYKIKVRNSIGQSLVGMALQQRNIKLAKDLIDAGVSVEPADLQCIFDYDFTDLFYSLLQRKLLLDSPVPRMSAEQWLDLQRCIPKNIEHRQAFLDQTLALALTYIHAPELKNKAKMQVLALHTLRHLGFGAAYALIELGVPALPNSDIENLGEASEMLRRNGAGSIEQQCRKLLTQLRQIDVPTDKMILNAHPVLRAELILWALENNMSPRVLWSCIESAESLGLRASGSTIHRLLEILQENSGVCRALAKAALTAGLTYWRDLPAHPDLKEYIDRVGMYAVAARLKSSQLHPVLWAQVNAFPPEATWEPAPAPRSGTATELLAAKGLWLQQNYPGRGTLGTTSFTVDLQNLHVLPDELATAHIAAWRRKFRINFMGHGGIDAGGITKEWLSKMGMTLFNPDGEYFHRSHTNPALVAPRQWRQEDGDGMHQHFLRFTGRLLGKALTLGLPINVQLPAIVLKPLVGEKVTLEDLREWDSESAQSLAQMGALPAEQASELGLDFTVSVDNFGEMLNVPLWDDGDTMEVDANNVAFYLNLRTRYHSFGFMADEFAAFAQGVFDIVPAKMLSELTSGQLGGLIAGEQEVNCDDWRLHTQHYRSVMNDQHESVRQPIDVSQGRRIPNIIKWFWEIVGEMSEEKRRQLIEAVTGSPGIPAGGFASFECPFNLVLLAASDEPPRSHTCFNQLDLPCYATKAKLRERLDYFIANAVGYGMA